MKRAFFLWVVFTINLFPQHLPLNIGNQWHYIQGLGPISPYVAFAVDTVRINNNLYYKIESIDAYADTLIRITYDRIEGDSTYFRLIYGIDKLIFNFAWQDSQVIVSPCDFDTTCFCIQIMNRSPATVWGIQTEYYSPNNGIYCPLISPDTSWALSGYSYLRYFGSFDADDGLLIGAVINDTIYGNLHQITDVENQEMFYEYSLFQNYPNPFNPRTIISFTIPKNQFVELKIYDILGNEVAVLVDEYKMAGKTTLEFDASDLSSGIYFYRIKARNFIKTKKLLLAK